MKTTAAAILELARKEIGTKEAPVNNVKYNALFYGREVSGAAYSWCCAFIWWLFHVVGADELFYGGRKTASCTTLWRWAQSQGLTITDGYMPGDIVFYDWDASGDCDHVGIVENVDRNTVITIEGNTSPANESNGGEVMRRTRTKKQIKGAFSPQYIKETKESDEEMTSEQFKEYMQEYRKSLQDNDHSAWAQEAIDFCIKNGIVNGGGNGADGKPNYMFQDLLTREQMMQLIYNFAKFLGKA